jgi:hypothetical protein
MNFEPNQIVTVKWEGPWDYRHYGEVMSRRCPNGTYMVRMVPAHPGTLKEIPEEMLTKVIANKPKYVHYAKVRGNGSFPYDMLRYDFAAPVNFSLTQEYPFHTKPNPVFDFGEELVVARASQFKQAGWTAERWRSFLWSCQPLAAELLNDLREL